MAKTRTFSLEITSDMANLTVVADFIATAGRQVRLTEKQFDDIQMAVDEAVTNVMEHAYAGRRDGEIFIRCTSDGREFFVEIRDSGKPFDPSTIKLPDTHSPLSKRSIGGLGIFFMRKLMDRVEFVREPHGNITRLTKKLK